MRKSAAGENFHDRRSRVDCRSCSRRVRRSQRPDHPAQLRNGGFAFSLVVRAGDQPRLYPIQSAIYGHLIARIFGLDGTGEYVAMAASAPVMGIFAMIGMETLAVLGLVAIPAIILLNVPTAMRAVSEVGGDLSAIMNMVPAQPISLAQGVILVIGTWIFSAATCIAEIMRFERSLKDAIFCQATACSFSAAR